MGFLSLQYREKPTLDPAFLTISTAPRSSFSLQLPVTLRNSLFFGHTPKLYYLFLSLSLLFLSKIPLLLLHVLCFFNSFPFLFFFFFLSFLHTPPIRFSLLWIIPHLFFFLFFFLFSILLPSVSLSFGSHEFSPLLPTLSPFFFFFLFFFLAPSSP